MNVQKAINAIKEGKIRFDRMDHDQLCGIVEHIVIERLQQLKEEHGDDFDVRDANELDNVLGHIQDDGLAHKVADWHLNAGAEEAARFVALYPDCDICAA